MGLSMLIQIPCHHVLANEISLNLKYCIDLKQFFKINLGIGIIKKLFLFVFSTYLPVFLLKFQSRELIGCGIKLCIQQVPTQHTFDRALYPKNKKYLKKTWWWHHHHIFFKYFLFLGKQRPSKVCSGGTRWM